MRDGNSGQTYGSSEVQKAELASGHLELRLNFSFNKIHLLLASPPGKMSQWTMRTSESTRRNSRVHKRVSY